MRASKPASSLGGIVRNARRRKARRDTLTVQMWEGPAWIEVRNRLVVENLEWARGIAGKVARRLPTWFSPDDLIAAAEIALLRLSDDYRSYQSVPFRAFAIQRLRGACYDAARRKEYKERGHQSLMGTADTSYASNRSGEARHEIQILDPGPNPEQLAELGEMERIWQHVDKLPERHAAVIRLIFREDMIGDEAGEVMGIKKARVSRLKNEALAMLREMVTK